MGAEAEVFVRCRAPALCWNQALVEGRGPCSWPAQSHGSHQHQARGSRQRLGLPIPRAEAGPGNKAGLEVSSSFGWCSW